MNTKTYQTDTIKMLELLIDNIFEMWPFCRHKSEFKCILTALLLSPTFA